MLNVCGKPAEVDAPIVIVLDPAFVTSTSWSGPGSPPDQCPSSQNPLPSAIQLVVAAEVAAVAIAKKPAQTTTPVISAYLFRRFRATSIPGQLLFIWAHDG
jgi:hypothetical protein